MLELVIEGRRKDLGGGLEVGRVLPFHSRRMVGPFIFLDHMGPADFASGEGIDVRPHPHIGLSTVTYLFDGEIHHRDSLGVSQLIRPGAVNWMTAGAGITHSERTDPPKRAQGGQLHGIQAWVALPLEAEETDPSFVHYAPAELPILLEPGIEARLMLLGGEGLGPRFIWWNFVSSSRDRIEQAKADWQAGRMTLPPEDKDEFIPLPDEAPLPPNRAAT